MSADNGYGKIKRIYGEKKILLVGNTFSKNGAVHQNEANGLLKLHLIKVSKISKREEFGFFCFLFNSEVFREDFRFF